MGGDWLGRLQSEGPERDPGEMLGGAANVIKRLELRRNLKAGDHA